MSKFKKDRSFNDNQNITQEIKANKFIESSPDIFKKNKESVKLVSVPLPESDALLLERLCEIEDRSQRKISARLLSESIKNEIKKYS